MKLRVSLRLYLLSLCCLVSYADDLVVIKGGREIHGQITGETETHLDIFTDYGRQLHIHKTRVSNIVRGAQSSNSEIAERLPASGQIQDRTTGTNYEKKWLVGVELGVANSGVSISPAPTTAPASKSGMVFGLLAEYPLTESLYLNPELLYSQLGYKSDATTTMKYSFLKIPLLAKYKYPIAKSFNLVGFGGLSIGILMGAKRETSDTSTDVSSTTRSSFYALEFGAGGEYVFTEKVNLFLNLRYAMALSSIDNTPRDPKKYKLHDLDVLFGVLYRL